MKDKISIYKQLEKRDGPINKILALGLSLLSLSIIIFYSREFVFPSVSESDFRTEFIDIQTLKSPRRAAKKTISTKEGEISKETSDNKTGGTEAETFVDLDFNPRVSKPSLIGRLKVHHPQIAREREIEAKAFVKLFISADGAIRKVKIFRLVLMKKVPPVLSQKLKEEFKINILKSLKGRRYRPAILNGKPVSVQSMQEIFLTLR